jgi:hypothetical protein
MRHNDRKISKLNEHFSKSEVSVAKNFKKISKFLEIKFSVEHSRIGTFKEQNQIKSISGSYSNLEKIKNIFSVNSFIKRVWKTV